MSIQNLIAPFDPTGYTKITGAQLKQLVDGAQAASDKGFIIVTNDTGSNPNPPDAVANPVLQRYVWLRVGATAVTPYVWNNNAGTNYDGTHSLLQWYTIASAAIGPNAITTMMLAPASVTDDKIVSVSGSKVTGSLSDSAKAGLLTLTTPFVGDVTGPYSATLIPNNSLNAAKLLDGTITDAKFAAGSTSTGLDPNKLKSSAVNGNIIATVAGVAAWAQVDIANPSKLPNLIAGTADAGKVLRIAADGQSYEKVAPIVAVPNCIAQIVIGKIIPAGALANGLLATVKITPKSTSSIIKIYFSSLWSWISGGGNSANLKLYRGDSTGTLLNQWDMYTDGPSEHIHAFSYDQPGVLTEVTYSFYTTTTSGLPVFNSTNLPKPLAEEIITSIVVNP